MVFSLSENIATRHLKNMPYLIYFTLNNLTPYLSFSDHLPNVDLRHAVLIENAQ